LAAGGPVLLIIWPAASLFPVDDGFASKPAPGSSRYCRASLPLYWRDVGDRLKRSLTSFEMTKRFYCCQFARSENSFSGGKRLPNSN